MLNVLALVDNEFNFQRKFNVLFRKLKLDYNLHLFSKGDDILKDYQTGKYSIVLIDQNLGDSELSGIEIGSKIKNDLGNHCIIIIVSINSGNDPYLIDFSMTEIEAAKAAKLNGWIIKKGAGLFERLQEFFNDIANDEFNEFRIYNR